jgi:hypothetical protein
MPKRSNFYAAVKTRVVLKALYGERTVSALAAAYKGHLFPAGVCLTLTQRQA